MHSRDIERGAAVEEKIKVPNVKVLDAGRAMSPVTACILYSTCSVGMVLSNKALASRYGLPRASESVTVVVVHHAHHPSTFPSPHLLASPHPPSTFPSFAATTQTLTFC